MRLVAPLRWPHGWPRTPAYERGYTRYRVAIEQAVGELHESLTALGARSGSVLLTINLSDDEYCEPDDPGVAVYWSASAYGERVMLRSLG